MFLGALVSGLTSTPEMEHADIRALVLVLALAALLLRAVVSLRIALLPLSFALVFLVITFTLAVPAGFILIFVDEGPAPVGDRFRELGASPREPISLNHPAATAEQVIV